MLVAGQRPVSQNPSAALGDAAASELGEGAAPEDAPPAAPEVRGQVRRLLQDLRRQTEIFYK